MTPLQALKKPWNLLAFMDQDASFIRLTVGSCYCKELRVQKVYDRWILPGVFLKRKLGKMQTALAFWL